MPASDVSFALYAYFVDNRIRIAQVCLGFEEKINPFFINHLLRKIYEQESNFRTGGRFF